MNDFNDNNNEVENNNLTNDDLIEAELESAPVEEATAEVAENLRVDEQTSEENTTASYTPDFSSGDISGQFKASEPQATGYGYNGSANVVVPELSFNEPRPEKVVNRGLKIFCLLLAFVIVIAAAATAGFFASEYSIGRNSSKAHSIGLASRPDNDAEAAESYTAAAEKIQKSVVSILVYGESSSSSQSSASGVVYSKDGYIVTNDHIYEGIADAKFLVRLYNGKEYKASYVAGDTRSDLAIIKLDDKSVSLEPATFGDSSQTIVGETVIALGYPSDYGDDFTLTHGIISAVNRRVTNTTTSYASSFIQTDAALNPGSSGGALANMYGQIIGITSSKLSGSSYESVSYAIPTVTMKSVVESLIKNKCVNDRAKLGITYHELNTVTAEQMSLPRGVYINTISSDSDLYGKGFQEGDVITHVNDKEITSSEVLLEVIESSKAGDSITLRIYRADKKSTKTVSVKLGTDKGSSSYNNADALDDSNIFGTQPDTSSGSSSSSDNNSSKTFDFPLN